MPADRNDPAVPYQRRVLIGAMIVIALIVLLYFLWQAVYVLLLVFAGVLLAVLLRSLAEGVCRWTGLPVGWSLGLVSVALLGAIVLLVWLAAPALSKQVGELSEQLPQSIESLKARVAQHKWGRWFVANAPTTRQVAERSQQVLLRSPGMLMS